MADSGSAYQKWLTDYFTNQAGLGAQNQRKEPKYGDPVTANVNSILNGSQDDATAKWYQQMFASQTNPSSMVGGANPAGGAFTNYQFGQNPMDARNVSKPNGWGTQAQNPTPSFAGQYAPGTVNNVLPGVGSNTTQPVSVGSSQDTTQGTDWTKLIAQLFPSSGGSNQSATANNPYAAQTTAQNTQNNAVSSANTANTYGAQATGTNSISSVGNGATGTKEETYPWDGDSGFDAWLRDQNLTSDEWGMFSLNPSAMGPYYSKYLDYKASIGQGGNGGRDEGTYIGKPAEQAIEGKGMNKYNPGTTWIYPNVDQNAFKAWLKQDLISSGKANNTTADALTNAMMQSPELYNSKIPEFQSYQKQQADPSGAGANAQIGEWLKRYFTGQTDNGQSYEFPGKALLMKNIQNLLNTTAQSDNPFGQNYQKQYTDPTAFYNNAAQDIQKAYDPNLINKFYDTSAGNIDAQMGTAAARAANAAAAMGGSNGMVNPAAYATAAMSNAMSPFASQLGGNESARANSLMTGNTNMYNQLAGNQTDLFKALFGNDQASVAQTQQQQQLQQNLSNQLFGQGTTLTGLGQLSSTNQGGFLDFLKALAPYLGGLAKSV
jgi:hypothetical protein